MQTQTHWMMTVLAGRFLKQKPPRWALGLGAIAPDIPLTLLSAGSIWYFTKVKGWSNEETFPHVFKNLFYNDPYWIFAHNLLHSPTSILLLMVMVWIFRKSGPRLARWLKFFLAGCLGHSLIDIPTHVDDGPLLLFPFNWNWRFQSTVSYWDRNHYGQEFMLFEGALNLVLIGTLLTLWVRSRSSPTNG